MKANTMITTLNYPYYYDTFINKQSAYTYSLTFDNNSFTNVMFNFYQTYSLFDGVIPSENKYMLKKFAGITLSPSNPTLCDCGLLGDFSFILNGAYSSSLKPTTLNTSNLAKTFCLYSGKSYNIYSLVLYKNFSLIRQFCPSITSRAGIVAPFVVHFNTNMVCTYFIGGLFLLLDFV